VCKKKSFFDYWEYNVTIISINYAKRWHYINANSSHSCNTSCFAVVIHQTLICYDFWVKLIHRGTKTTWQVWLAYLSSQVRIPAVIVNFFVLIRCWLREVAVQERSLSLPICSVTQATHSALSAYPALQGGSRLEGKGWVGAIQIQSAHSQP
jgi:hypothetical protein